MGFKFKKMGIFSLFVKLSGMSEKGEIRGEIKRLEKKRGKEDEKD